MMLFVRQPALRKTQYVLYQDTVMIREGLPVTSLFADRLAL
jgi:hypothetical protein